MDSKPEADKYALFKKFPNLGQAKEFALTLQDNNIEFTLVDNSHAVDITFTGNLQNEIQVLVKQSQFAAANQLLEKQAEQLLDEVEKDHYLFDFSNEELYEILMKPDEWSAFDRKLAQKILTDKGQEVNQDLINTLKKQRIDDLAKPEKGQKPWIIVGYLFAFLGGLIGVFIGWYLWRFKKTLPDGRKVYAYNDSDRKQGRNIFFIGTVLFLFWLAVRTILEF